MQSSKTSGSRPCGLRARRPERRRSLAALALVALALACRRSRHDELRVSFATELASLDPHFENTIAAIEQLGNVYEPLVTLDSEMRIRPCLADSWSNPDSVTWVFRLRPSVVFHDGTPLTERDVVFSLTRPRGDESLKISSYLSNVSEVKASGSDTVVVRTRSPNALLLGYLSFVPIVRDGSTGGTLEARPNGTGPWRVEAWTPRRALRLKRNERYWGPKPPFDRASVDFAVSEQEALAGIGAGRWDVVRYSSADVEAQARHRRTYDVVHYPNIFLRHLAFDVSRERTPFCPGIPNPFRRREVRQAVSLALDRTALARRVDAEAIAASQLVPPSIFGFDRNAPPLPRDLDRARQLLAEAGFPDGFDVVLHRSGYAAAAEEVKVQLARVGIRVTVEHVRSADFFEALNRGDLSFWIVADGCITGDALELLLGSFRTPDPAAGAGVDNYGGYRNPGLDLAIAEALRQIDPASRLPVLQRSLRTVLDDAPWVPLYFSREAVVVRRPLTFRPRADGMLRLADVERGG